MQDTIFTPEHLIMQNILTKMSKSRAQQQNSQIIRAVKEWKGQICLSWLWIGDRISIGILQRRKSKCRPNLRKTTWQQGMAAACAMSPKACTWVLSARKYIKPCWYTAQRPRDTLGLRQWPATVITPCTFSWMFSSALHVSSSQAACRRADVKQMSSPFL